MITVPFSCSSIMTARDLFKESIFGHYSNRDYFHCPNTDVQERETKIPCPTTIHQDYFADILNAYSPEETLPDCMSDKALDKYRGSSNSKGRIKDCHLCEHYKGRLLSQYCNYRHPNIVHYVKLSKPNAKNKLTFQEFVSILSVDKFYKPDEIVIHCNDPIITGGYWEKAINLSTSSHYYKKYTSNHVYW